MKFINSKKFYWTALCLFKCNRFNRLFLHDKGGLLGEEGGDEEDQEEDEEASAAVDGVGLAVEVAGKSFHATGEAVHAAGEAVHAAGEYRAVSVLVAVFAIGSVVACTSVAIGSVVPWASAAIGSVVPGTSVAIGSVVSCTSVAIGSVVACTSAAGCAGCSGCAVVPVGGGATLGAAEGGRGLGVVARDEGTGDVVVVGNEYGAWRPTHVGTHDAVALQLVHELHGALHGYAEVLRQHVRCDGVAGGDEVHGGTVQRVALRPGFFFLGGVIGQVE